MPDYTMAQAKRDFEMGYLADYHIQRVILGSGWWVWLKSDGMAAGPLVDARTKKAREFKTLDAAVSAIESVGFKVEGLLRG